MSEALEKWDIDVFKKTLPRIYQICVELDHHCRADLTNTFHDDEAKINYMAVLGDGAGLGRANAMLEVEECGVLGAATIAAPPEHADTLACVVEPCAAYIVGCGLAVLCVVV